MIELPASTLFNRRIPKQKFYDNISVTPQLKRAFDEQIRSDNLAKQNCFDNSEHRKWPNG